MMLGSVGSAQTDSPVQPPVAKVISLDFVKMPVSPAQRYNDTVLVPLHAAQATAAMEAARQQALANREALEAAQTAAQVQPTPSPAAVAYTAPQSLTDYYEAWIFNEESGNNPEAINAYSGACGLGQAEPCSKMPCSLSDYNCQVNYFTGYMLERYGSWYAAYEAHIAQGWW